MYFANSEIEKLANLQGWNIEWVGTFAGVWRDREHLDRVFIRPEDYQPHTNPTHTIELVNDLKTRGWAFTIQIDASGYEVTISGSKTVQGVGKNFSEVICTLILEAIK